MLIVILYHIIFNKGKKNPNYAKHYPGIYSSLYHYCAEGNIKNQRLLMKQQVVKYR
ncbi:hypothetical protein DCAR_0100699 [Daucus carota subsp. sativus]|uniref:Uncharacterized protein n=1 Tax=Daucus carota subsp. sativus TaxID=79200 RepID=A0A166FUW8_DAUCS|nr:hypothetical protein DCAR_0100699 [Daucus carota subsp. sativus]